MKGKDEEEHFEESRTEAELGTKIKSVELERLEQACRYEKRGGSGVVGILSDAELR